MKRWYQAYDPMESLQLWMDENNVDDIVEAIPQWTAAQEPLLWQLIHALRGVWYAVRGWIDGRPF